VFITLYFTDIGAGLDVIIEGDWYEPVDFSPLGLAQVEYSPNFENESCGFLRDSDPHNYTLWPSDPYEEYKKTGRILTEVDRTPGRRYCVIAHGVGETFDLEDDRKTEPELIQPTPAHEVFRSSSLEVQTSDNNADGNNKQKNKRNNCRSSRNRPKPKKPKSTKKSKESSDSEDDEGASSGSNSDFFDDA
jgi:hypothetical protein